MTNARYFKHVLPIAFSLLVLSAGTGCQHSVMTAPTTKSSSLDDVARSYVRLVLALGEHDASYVDAYYGPPEWREQVKAEKKPLATIRQDAELLVSDIDHTSVKGTEQLVNLRRVYLRTQLRALIARTEMLGGKKFTFEEEAQALYDAQPPRVPTSKFDAVLARLAVLLPGEGPLAARYEAFRKDFTIPKEKVDTVFTAAIAEARRRTLRHIDLPARETFAVEYVTGKSWSAYNWYKGNSYSVIQVNTDLPISIDKIIHLAVHEGYPGHHVYNALLEQRLVRDRGWVEFTVYPLFTPQSLIAEGSANYGVELAFPADDRLKFARDVLFPLAGLDPSRAESFFVVQNLLTELKYARNEAARQYLNGTIDAEAATEFQTKYSMMTRGDAARSTRFFDDYRSYVINYNLGEDLIRRYMESKAGSGGEERKWKEFEALLSSPRLPSTLR
ncbi:MAG TPA: hypothetical protein VNM92_05360 [Thermoanaerobaculia bacterium]|nr:hypothetical protein [Thermoanaerobaculia bacterium]